MRVPFCLVKSQMDQHPFQVLTKPEPPVAKWFGTKDPMWAVTSTRPWYEAAAVMFAAGAVTAKEVARSFGVTEPTVNNLIRQPFFQARVTELMQEHGGRDIMSLFRAEGFNSFVKLKELRDATTSPSTIQRSCALDILDRAFGKPVQRVENTQMPTSDDPVAEVRRLEEQNERLRK